MRGKHDPQSAMFFAIDLNDRIRPDHPLRPIKLTVDAELAMLNDRFDAAYARHGRPSVPPERLLKALLLQCLYSLRSERQLVERIDTDLLFRWFLDMDPAEDAFDATAFTHNRQRLEDHGLIAAFFDGIVRRVLEAKLASEEHFSVDGTLIESYASLKSFQPVDPDQDDEHDNHAHHHDGNRFKPRNAEVNWHGQKRSNATHRSRTDPQARLYKKANGQAAKLSHGGHLITDNRHGLVLAVHVSEASGTAEPTAALAMVDHLQQTHGLTPRTLGSDKGYDSGSYLLELESRGITPHTAMRAGPVGGVKGTSRLLRKNRPKIAARQRMVERMKTLGYAISQRCRKKVEEPFGWMKTVAGLARSRWVGRWKLQQQMQLAGAAYNLVRMRKLLAG